jgi:hypothetical protein
MGMEKPMKAERFMMPYETFPELKEALVNDNSSDSKKNGFQRIARL